MYQALGYLLGIQDKHNPCPTPLHPLYTFRHLGKSELTKHFQCTVIRACWGHGS